MKRYNVQIDRWGGEVTIGRLSKKSNQYWKQRGEHLLEDHLLVDSVESVPSEYNLHPWYDQDDLLHICGPEFSEHNVLTITDIDSGEVMVDASVFEDSFQDNTWVLDPVEDTLPDLQGGGLIYCMSVEKGGWIFDDIETEDELDISKLTFYVYDFDGMFVLDHMRYKEQDLNVIDGETIRKDWNFWYDLDFPD